MWIKMANKIMKYVIAYVLLVYGSFYAFFKHSIHQKYAPDWLIAGQFNNMGFPHTVHVIGGAIFVIAGIIYVFVLYKKKY